MKRCTSCGQHKPLAEFPADKGHRDGHASWCRSCYGQSRVDWGKANKARQNAIALASYHRCKARKMAEARA